MIAALSMGAFGLAYTPECNATRKMFQDTQCCGDGNGEAFCAASKSFDFADLTTRLDEIKTLVTASTPTAEPYLDELCFPNAPVETSTLGTWPPSAQAAAYANADGYPSYGGKDPTQWPHTPGYPPYMGLCTSARGAMSIISTVCPALGTIGEPDFYPTYIAATKTEAAFNQLSPQCQAGAKMIAMFSMVLQFEYTYSHGEATTGRSYFNSIMLGEVTGFPGAMTMTNMESSYATLAASMQPHLPAEAYFGLVITVETYLAHVSVTRDSAKFTSSMAIASSKRVKMYKQNDKYYPENFEICLASRRMYDYMTQNPTNFYPTDLGGAAYGEGYNYMFRCGTRGSLILKAQSTILGAEKDAQIDPTTCPSVEGVKDVVDAASQALRWSGEKYTMQSCLVGVGCPQFSGPSNAETFWLMRDDAEYMRSLWVTFLYVHLKALKEFCGKEYVASDPWGDTIRQFSIDELEQLAGFQNSLYPVVKQAGYTSPYPNCTNYGYSEGIPHESPCTLSNYPQGNPHSGLVTTWAEYSFPEERVCDDDPVSRYHMHNYPPFGAKEAALPALLGYITEETRQAFLLFAPALVNASTACVTCMVYKPALTFMSQPSRGGTNFVVPARITDVSIKDMYPKSCTEHCAGYWSSPYCSS